MLYLLSYMLCVLFKIPLKIPFSKYGSGDLVKARVIRLRDRPITELVIDYLFL